MIAYQTDLGGISAQQLEGFFVEWPDPPSPATHLRMLKGSAHVVLALEGDQVIGFVTAISDGVLSAYISLLEVLPDYQGRVSGSRRGARTCRAHGCVAGRAVHD